MTTAFLAADLKREEGRPGTGAPLLVAEPDPISHGAPWTAGWGHTGPDVQQGTTCTFALAEAWLAKDIAAVEDQLDRDIPWWRTLSDLRQDVLANMAFNMGVHGLLEFRMMLANCRAGNYQQAAAEMMSSDWAAQVGDRAQVLAQQMMTNVHVAPTT